MSCRECSAPRTALGKTRSWVRFRQTGKETGWPNPVLSSEEDLWAWPQVSGVMSCYPPSDRRYPSRLWTLRQKRNGCAFHAASLSPPRLSIVAALPVCVPVNDPCHETSKHCRSIARKTRVSVRSLNPRKRTFVARGQGGGSHRFMSPTTRESTELFRCTSFLPSRGLSCHDKNLPV
jgi:hypothetical protein